jgi:probable rRNA maturation factor
MLGDVIVSVDTARRQAPGHRHPLLAELTVLLAHGLLHLLGYDHQTDAQEQEMNALTGELVAAAAVRRQHPLPRRAAGQRPGRAGKKRPRE